MGSAIRHFSAMLPLEEDQKEGLLIPTIATRGELDEFEQQNIEAAVQWTFTRSFRAEDVLTESFVRNLHQRMFGNVWRWAGSFRRTNKNIGIDKHQIGVELRLLLDDCLFWVNAGTYPPDEIAVRFKHRLVFIHCFHNGNGRHARLMADILAARVLGERVFTWGSSTLRETGAARSAYIAALRAADNGDIQPLLRFARS
ncbi:MAG: mobile mystery protein B [Bacteroidia bacterium]|nr:mobile mystery protein B [Bacteroidia bacterium]